MKADLYSVSKIFTERLLRIPDYQRGYAWTEKHLKDFWNDLDQLSEGKNHYTGVLTLEDVPAENLTRWDEDHWIINAKSYAPHYVVDGQQRLTTSIILIQAITEAVNPEVKINYTTIDDIRKNLFSSQRMRGFQGRISLGMIKIIPVMSF